MIQTKTATSTSQENIYNSINKRKEAFIREFTPLYTAFYLIPNFKAREFKSIEDAKRFTQKIETDEKKLHKVCNTACNVYEEEKIHGVNVKLNEICTRGTNNR